MTTTTSQFVRQQLSGLRVDAWVGHTCNGNGDCNPNVQGLLELMAASKWAYRKALDLQKHAQALQGIVKQLEACQGQLEQSIEAPKAVNWSWADQQPQAERIRLFVEQLLLFAWTICVGVNGRIRSDSKVKKKERLGAVKRLLDAMDMSVNSEGAHIACIQILDLTSKKVETQESFGSLRSALDILNTALQGLPTELENSLKGIRQCFPGVERSLKGTRVRRPRPVATILENARDHISSTMTMPWDSKR